MADHMCDRYTDCFNVQRLLLFEPKLCDHILYNYMYNVVVYSDEINGSRFETIESNHS